MTNPANSVCTLALLMACELSEGVPQPASMTNENAKEIAKEIAKENDGVINLFTVHLDTHLYRPTGALHGSLGLILNLPGQLSAGSSDVITARLARGGHDICLHQHIAETLNGIRA